jgi:hypothetical protein
MRRSHLGVEFEVWDSKPAWFWMVIDPLRSGGAIGAAATEAEAVREACVSINEMSAERRAAETSSVVNAKSAVPEVDRSDAASSFVINWQGSLARLERYLTRVSGATA